MHEVLTISSLARAVAGNASIADVGALAWMTLRSVVPATSMAMFVEDERQDLLTVALRGRRARADAAPVEEGARRRHRRLGRPSTAAASLNADAGARSRSRRRTRSSRRCAARVDRPAHPATAASSACCRATPRPRQASPTTICGCSKLLAASLASAMTSATQSAEAAPMPRAAGGSRRALTLVG